VQVVSGDELCVALQQLSGELIAHWKFENE